MREKKMTALVDKYKNNSKCMSQLAYTEKIIDLILRPCFEKQKKKKLS